MDILEATSFLLRPLQFLNLTQWLVDYKSGRVQRSRFLIVYTLFILMFSITFLLVGLLVDEGYNTNFNDIGQTVDFIQLVGIRVAHILSILETLLRRHDQLKFFNKIREIDRYFERTLNMAVNNGDFRRKIIHRGILMLIVYVGSELFVFATNFLDSNDHFSVFRIFYFWPFLVCGVRYFQIFLSIAVIKKRLELLIVALEKINLRCQNVVDVTDNKQSCKIHILWEFGVGNIHGVNQERVQLKQLVYIRNLYDQLWDLSNILNRCIGLSLLFNFGNDFLAVTTNCYWIFVNFTSAQPDFVTIIGTFIWSIPHLCNVLALAILCDCTTQCTTLIALRLHRIESNNSNDNHNTVIEQFSLQLIHQKITFNATGFLKVDSTLLYTMIGATTTYLIILIQFHMSG